MFFIVNANLPIGGSLPSAYGPFQTEDDAKAAAAKIVFAGSYDIYGPSDKISSFSVTAPSVEFKSAAA